MKLFSWIKIHIKDGCNVVVRRELKSIIKNKIKVKNENMICLERSFIY